MALILNIETATTVCSVSLANDGRLIALKEQNGDYSHAENLTLFIEDIFKQAGKKLNETDAIAVSKGPGSYTGLRIGVSSAKGLCCALNKPLISVNTLQAMALGISIKKNNEYLLCPMIDARRMEVYCALYDQNNNEIKSTSAEIIDEHSFSDILKNNTIVFFGDGAEKCKSVLSENKNAVFIDNVFPSAKNLIELSLQSFINNDFEDVAYFEPFYLKDFVAGKKK